VLQGKKLIFVTNNSTKSRKQYMKKFLDLGLSVTEVRTKGVTVSARL
jgi:ribonucleotide monophosphatase NagD (HAD superfamily)